MSAGQLVWWVVARVPEHVILIDRQVHAEGVVNSPTDNLGTALFCPPSEREERCHGTAVLPLAGVCDDRQHEFEHTLMRDGTACGTLGASSEIAAAAAAATAAAAASAVHFVFIWVGAYRCGIITAQLTRRVAAYRAVSTAGCVTVTVTTPRTPPTTTVPQASPARGDLVTAMRTTELNPILGGK
jgi:hypothetical protein